jgi:hypothetical protein
MGSSSSTSLFSSFFWVLGSHLVSKASCVLLYVLLFTTIGLCILRCLFDHHTLFRASNYLTLITNISSVHPPSISVY